MHPVHNFPRCIPKINSNIIFPSIPRSSEWSVHVFRPKFCVHVSFLKCFLQALPSDPHWFDHYRDNLVKSTSYEAPYYAVFSIFLPLPPSYVQIFSSAPCSQTSSICVLPLSVRDQVSHPYKTYLLIPWCIILFEKLVVTQLFKKYHAFFMEPESSLPYSQKPATGPYPEPAESLSP